MAKLKLWIVSTCVPGETEPCLPSAFADEASAEAYADSMLRNEWDANGPEDDETGERKPYPGDWREAQTGIVEWLRGLHTFGKVGDHTDDEWGEWQITSHEIEIGGSLARAASELYWFTKAVLEQNPDLETPTTFDGGSDVMGRLAMAVSESGEDLWAGTEFTR